MKKFESLVIFFLERKSGLPRILIFSEEVGSLYREDRILIFSEEVGSLYGEEVTSSQVLPFWKRKLNFKVSPPPFFFYYSSLPPFLFLSAIELERKGLRPSKERETSREGEGGKEITIAREELEIWAER